MELKLEQSNIYQKPEIDIDIRKVPSEYEDCLRRELKEIKELLELLGEDI